jgi:hypothetical protein
MRNDKDKVLHAHMWCRNIDMDQSRYWYINGSQNEIFKERRQIKNRANKKGITWNIKTNTFEDKLINNMMIWAHFKDE